MTVDYKTSLLLSHLSSDNGDRDVDIEQSATIVAMDVVVSVNPSIESACLVSKRELLNESAFSEQVQGSVDGSVCHTWILPPDALVDLPGGHVAIGAFDLFENH